MLTKNQDKDYTTGCLLHCTENHISFFQTSWKDGLSQKIALEYDLSCIIGKDDISLYRKYDLIPETENERWSFWKKCTEIWYFLQTFWKDGFSKRVRAGTWFFLYHLERWFFFSPNTWYFFPGQKVRGGHSQEIHGNVTLSVYTYGCYKRGATPLLQKKIKDGLIPQKYS